MKNEQNVPKTTKNYKIYFNFDTISDTHLDGLNVQTIENSAKIYVLRHTISQQFRLEALSRNVPCHQPYLIKNLAHWRNEICRAR